MPTLYGASSGSPGITPAIVGTGWTRTSTGIQRMPAVLTDTSTTATWSDASVASVHSSCLGQWIYGPLAAQTISGTLSAKVYGSDATFTNIYISAIAAWVATSAGALRGTLLAKTNDPGAVNWTTNKGAFTIAAQTLSSVAATAGDYLILEAGLADTAFTNAEIGRLYAGASQTQFTLSQALQLFNPASVPNVIWLGKPQPRRS